MKTTIETTLKSLALATATLLILPTIAVSTAFADEAVYSGIECVPQDMTEWIEGVTATGSYSDGAIHINTSAGEYEYIACPIDHDSSSDDDLQEVDVYVGQGTTTDGYFSCTVYNRDPASTSGSYVSDADTTCTGYTACNRTLTMTNIDNTYGSEARYSLRCRLSFDTTLYGYHVEEG